MDTAGSVQIVQVLREIGEGGVVKREELGAKLKHLSGGCVSGALTRLTRLGAVKLDKEKSTYRDRTYIVTKKIHDEKLGKERAKPQYNGPRAKTPGYRSKVIKFKGMTRQQMSEHLVNIAAFLEMPNPLEFFSDDELIRELHRRHPGK